MKILALDLGTNTGFAYEHDGKEQMAGTWGLATPKEVKAWGINRLRRRCDPRVERLSNLIKRCPRPDMIVFEDVQFSSSTYQTQLWASLRGAVWLTSVDLRTRIDCVPTGTLKQFATGSGNATKEMMLAAAERAEPGRFMGLDDNAVDAYWILKWAQKHLTRAVKA